MASVKHVLSMLRCSNAGQPNKDAFQVYQLLDNHPYITSLDASMNNIGVEGAKYIAKIRQLKKLTIDHTDVCDEGAKALLLGCPALEHLNIERTCLTDAIVPAIKAKIAEKGPLKILEMSDNSNVDEEEIERIYCLLKGVPYDPKTMEIRGGFDALN